MFSFIKKLFATPAETIEIPKQELAGWFNKQFEEKTAVLKIEANTTVEQLKDLLDRLNQAAEKLRVSEGDQKAKVKQKIKQVVLSNRDSLVHHISLFCQRTKLPEKQPFDQTLEELKSLREQINSLAKQTEKSYHIAQHLFFNEVESTAKLLKEFDTTITNLESKLNNAKFEQLKDIQSKIQKMHHEQETKKALQEEKEAMEKEKENVEKTKQELQKQKENIEGSHEYKKLSRRKQELKETQEKLTQRKNAIFHMFSQFQRPLRKLTKICLNNKNLTQNYAEDPLKAFRNDSMLIIATVLQDLERNIKNGSIELKNKEKTLAKITELSKEKIQQTREDWLNTEKQIKELEEKITTNETKQSLEKLENKIHEAESRLTKISVAIMDIDKKNNTIIIKPLEEEIIEKINTTLKTQLSLC